MKKVLATLCLFCSITACAGSPEPGPNPQHNNANAPSDQYNQQYQELNKSGAYQRNFNVRFLGSGIFVGFIGTAIDFEVKRNFTVGPMAKGFAFGTHSGYLLGVDGIYATNGNVFSNTWFVNPYVAYYSSNYKRNGSSERSGVLGINFGYQWMFANSFNAQVGAGAYFANHPIPLSITEKGNFFPTFMMAVGYAF